MTQEAAVPASWKAQIQKWIDAAVAKALRSAPIRNTSITEGRVTIRGGALVVEAADGSPSAYFGGIYPAMPDGNLQPGFILRREDGSIAAALYDPTPDPTTPDGFKQFYAVYDRAGNIVFSDDTSSGQGMARPYVPGSFHRARYGDWSVSTTAAGWETLWRAEVFKQQPRLSVATNASMDTAGTTGEIRVMVNGAQLGSTAAIGFAQTTTLFGPAAVAGSHMQLLAVEVQGQRTSASGALRVEPLHLQGRQS